MMLLFLFSVAATSLSPLARFVAPRLGLLLRERGYDAKTVGERLVGRSDLLAPTVLVKRRVERAKPVVIADAVDALIVLFVLGLEVPTSKLDLELLCALRDSDAVVVTGELARATCALVPVGDLVLRTDFAPPRDNCPATESPVMYIGPDSAALVGAIGLLNVTGKRVLDLCAGSGVQGLAALSGGASYCLAIEREHRAATFATYNARLNRDTLFSSHRTATTTHPEEATTPSREMSFDVVLANPPFVAVPPSLRYDVFADGGPNGEAVVEGVVRAAHLALKDDGLLAIVLEVNGSPQDLARRLIKWWDDESSMKNNTRTTSSFLRCAVVAESTNDRGNNSSSSSPVPQTTTSAQVADRRGGSFHRERWLQNLNDQGISSVRNGFIFATPRRRRQEGYLDSSHHLDDHEIRVFYAARLWAPPPCCNAESQEAVSAALRWLREGPSTYSS